MEKKIHTVVKESILKNLGSVELKNFGSSSEDIQLILIAIRIDVEDVSIDMWKAVKKCYCLLSDGNKAFNDTAVEICSRIVSDSYSGGVKFVGSVIETNN